MIASKASTILAVLRIPSSLLSAVNRSDMTLDVPCPGLLRLLLAVYSQRGQNLTFTTLKLSVKRIHIKRPRFLSELVVTDIFRSRLDALGVFYKIQGGPKSFNCLRKHFSFA